MRAANDLALPIGTSARTTPEARGLRRDEVRLLVSRGGDDQHASFAELARFLPPGSLLVVNSSATLPASLAAMADFGGFVLNLSTPYAPGFWLAEPRWSHDRPGPVPLSLGETFEAAGMAARLIAPYPDLARLCFVAFDGDVQRAMADEGLPIRYGYLEPPFPALAAYQSMFATTPGSAEMPSAARPFTPRVMNELTRRGILVASIELHSGVSSLEVAPEDRPVLFPEPFRVPPATALAVNDAREHGRPVIAVGTTVVRALESAWDGQRLRPAAGFTRLFISPEKGVNTVDGLITGFHDPRGSHLALLRAIAGTEVIDAAYRVAARDGYLWHEFGDSHLIFDLKQKRSTK